MKNLIPNQPLIYERANSVVYARYANMPNVDRWIVGGDPVAVGQAQGELLPYSEWVSMCELALTNHTLKKQLDKAVEIYFLIRNNR